MKIFIDESGNFISGEGETNFSCIGALTIPTLKLDKVYQHYTTISANWPRDENGEIKGKALEEGQVIEVAKLLRKYDCLFELVAIDLNSETADEIIAHKEGQAERIIESISDKFSSNLVESLLNLSKAVKGLSLQLYVQSVLLTELIPLSLHHSTLYYAQRKPSELAEFDWVIDAKDRRLTPYEKYWKEVVGPILQTKSISNPCPIVDDARFNYSYFDKRFETKIPDHIKVHYPASDKSETAINIKEVMRSLTFQQSHHSIGLQLVDILVNAIRRILHGNLSSICAENIGQLMIIKKRRQNIEFLTLSGQSKVPGGSKGKVVIETTKALSRFGRKMIKK